MTTLDGSSAALDALFNPRSIALVGASDSSWWSQKAFHNLLEFGADLRVHCVNPRRATVHGQPAHPSLAELPEPVDLAFVMVRTESAARTLDEAAAQGIHQAVLLTSGFAETGEAGKQAERALRARVVDHGMTVLGPNTLGFANLSDGVVAYPGTVPAPLVRGSVGVVLQSGALGVSVLGLAHAHHVGLSLMATVGNQMLVSISDVVRHLVHDERTTVIALFLESIDDPAGFADACRAALAAGKPVVAYKVGRHEAGARAARAHTGALVGDDTVVDAAFRRLGVIRVDSLEDLLTTAGLLAGTGPLRGRRVAVVTPSGGACDISGDRATDEGLELPEFTPATSRALTGLLPPFATVQNPLDVTGHALVHPEVLDAALRTVLTDPGFDLAICVTGQSLLSRRLAEVEAGGSDPLPGADGEPVVHTIVVAEQTTADVRRLIDRTGITYSGAGIDRVWRAVGHAAWWSEHRHDCARTRTGIRATGVTASPGDRWTEVRTHRLLAAAGIPVVPHGLAVTAGSAAAIAQRVGLPVALKIVSPDLAHKTDVGGVELGLHTADAVRAAFARIMQAAGRLDPPPEVDGVLVAPMRDGGVELLVGVTRDPGWGLVLTVGLGGVWVEALRDTTSRLLPVDARDVHAMLGELRGAALLRGVRGRPPADLDRVADAIARIAGLAANLDDRLDTLEVNPLWVDGTRVEALDALVQWRSEDGTCS